MMCAFCHSEHREESLINGSASVRTDEPEMFRFAQQDRRTAVRFFS
jgi:hypothetical protein